MFFILRVFLCDDNEGSLVHQRFPSVFHHNGHMDLAPWHIMILPNNSYYVFDAEWCSSYYPKFLDSISLFQRVWCGNSNTGIAKAFIKFHFATMNINDKESFRALFNPSLSWKILCWIDFEVNLTQNDKALSKLLLMTKEMQKRAFYEN